MSSLHTYENVFHGNMFPRLTRTRVGDTISEVAEPKGQFYETLGERLAAARKGQDVTQGRLAAAVGLSRTSVTNIEKGRQQVPVHVLVKIAHTLGVPITTLLPGVDELSAPARVTRQISALEPGKQGWVRRVLTGSADSKETT